MFRYGQGIIDFNAEIPDGALDLPAARSAPPTAALSHYFYPADLYGPGLHELHAGADASGYAARGAEITTARLHDAFDCTKGMPLLQIAALKARRIPIHDRKLLDPGVGTALYDIVADPQQLRPFRDAVIERRIHAGIAIEMRAHHAPAGLFERYGIAV